MGNEPVFAEEQLSLESSHAHRRTDNEDQAKREERLDLGGGPRVPRGTARRPQRLSASAREKGNRSAEDVRIPASANERSGPRTPKHRKAGFDARRQRKVRCTLQKPAVLP